MRHAGFGILRSKALDDIDDSIDDDPDDLPAPLNFRSAFCEQYMAMNDPDKTRLPSGRFVARITHCLCHGNVIRYVCSLTFLEDATEYRSQSRLKSDSDRLLLQRRK